MDRLLAIGFGFAGHWLMENGKLKCDLIRYSSQKNVLYAFVYDGQVKYVGKTKDTLASRMNGYRTPGKTQTTNIKNNAHIKELLAKNVAVEIFALPDNGLMHYGQFHLNLAAALEDDIIRVIDPEWNGGVPESVVFAIDEALEITAATEPELKIPALVRGNFKFVLHPTYYGTGFFNVRTDSEQLLGADGETIEIFLGEESQPILGEINRRANKNGTPRVMGGKDLKRWFKAQATEMAEISVEVMSPKSIRLNVE